MERAIKEIEKISKRFFKRIKNEKKIFLTFDLDNDGFCSAIAFSNFLKHLKIKPILFLSKKEDREMKVIDSIQKFLNSSAKTFISLDLPPTGIYEENSEIFKIKEKIEKSKKQIIFFDHHLYDEKRVKNVYVINPRFYKKSLYLSTSATLYLIFKKIFIDKKSIFFLSIGDYSDKSNFKELQEKAFNFFPNLKSKIDLYAKRLNSFLLISSHSKILNFVQKISEKDLESKTFINAEKKIENEIKKEMKKVKIGRKMIFHIVKSKYNIKSIIANLLLEKYDKTILVAKIKNDIVNISARSKKVNLIEILESMKEKFKEMKFGGHENACGVKIPKQKLNSFLKIFKSSI